MAVSINFSLAYGCYIDGQNAAAAGQWDIAICSWFFALFYLIAGFTTISLQNYSLPTEKREGSVIGDTSKLTPDERKVVDDLVSQGKRVEIIPRSDNSKTPDFYVDGIKTELKTLNGNSMNTLVKRIGEGFNQGASVVIIDARKTGITISDAEQIIARALGKYKNHQFLSIVLCFKRGGEPHAARRLPEGAPQGKDTGP